MDLQRTSNGSTLGEDTIERVATKTTPIPILIIAFGVALRCAHLVSDSFFLVGADSLWFFHLLNGDETPGISEGVAFLGYYPARILGVNLFCYLYPLFIYLLGCVSIILYAKRYVKPYVLPLMVWSFVPISIYITASGNIDRDGLFSLVFLIFLMIQSRLSAKQSAIAAIILVVTILMLWIDRVPKVASYDPGIGELTPYFGLGIVVMLGPAILILRYTERRVLLWLTVVGIIGSMIAFRFTFWIMPVLTMSALCTPLKITYHRKIMALSLFMAVGLSLSLNQPMTKVDRDWQNALSWIDDQPENGKVLTSWDTGLRVTALTSKTSLIQAGPTGRDIYENALISPDLALYLRDHGCGFFIWWSYQDHPQPASTPVFRSGRVYVYAP